MKVGIITPPRGEAATTPLSNLANILNELSSRLYVITGGNVRILRERSNNEIYIYKINYKIHSNVITKLVNHLFMQLRFSINVSKLSKIVDAWVFFLDGEGLLLPLLTVKLTKGKALLVMAASIAKTGQVHKDYLNQVSARLRFVSYNLSNSVILYSDNLVKEWQLEKHKHNISIAHEHFLNLSTFRIEKQVNERDSIVGYVGRLSKEKGVLNFLQAIPMVLKRRDPIEFVIGGDGPLGSRIKEFVVQRNLSNKVKLTGWIPHEKLPSCLNELKLLVLPSFTEGLPNILLEAMACGTPVLATPVGAIPDVIRDGETGFYLKSNDPRHIANRIAELSSKPELLEKVSINAYRYVRDNFSYEKTLETWRKIFEELKST